MGVAKGLKASFCLGLEVGAVWNREKKRNLPPPKLHLRDGLSP